MTVIVKAVQRNLPPGGQWKTIRGSRVFIKDGRVVAGPAALRGMEMRQQPAVAASGAEEGTLHPKFPMEKIQADPTQARKHFDDESLRELAESIKEHGLVQPVTVRPMGDDKFQIVAGERRFRAHQLLGAKHIRALVEPMGQERARSVQLIENLQRKDLNPMEEAHGYADAMAENQWDIEHLAKMVKKSPATIEGKLSLRNLLPEFQGLVQKGQLSETHGRQVAKLKPDWQRKAFRQIVDRDLTTTQTKKVVEGLLASQQAEEATQGMGLFSAEVMEKLDTMTTREQRVFADRLQRFFASAERFLSGVQDKRTQGLTGAFLKGDLERKRDMIRAIRKELRRVEGELEAHMAREKEGGTARAKTAVNVVSKVRKAKKKRRRRVTKALALPVVVKAAERNLPSGGEWKTIRGSRVYIHNGRVVAGPASLHGLQIGQAPRSKGSQMPWPKEPTWANDKTGITMVPIIGAQATLESSGVGLMAMRVEPIAGWRKTRYVVTDNPTPPPQLVLFPQLRARDTYYQYHDAATWAGLKKKAQALWDAQVQEHEKRTGKATREGSESEIFRARIEREISETKAGKRRTPIEMGQVQSGQALKFPPMGGAPPPAVKVRGRTGVARLQATKVKRIPGFVKIRGSFCNTPERAAGICSEIRRIDRETVWTVHCDERDRPTSCELTSLGAMEKTTFHPRDVLKISAQVGAKSVWLVHNHPAGNVTPSLGDVLAFRASQLAGEAVGIKVSDLVVIGSGGRATSTARFVETCKANGLSPDSDASWEENHGRFLEIGQQVSFKVSEQKKAEPVVPQVGGTLWRGKLPEGMSETVATDQEAARLVGHASNPNKFSVVAIHGNLDGAVNCVEVYAAKGREPGHIQRAMQDAIDGIPQTSVRTSSSHVFIGFGFPEGGPGGSFLRDAQGKPTAAGEVIIGSGPEMLKGVGQKLNSAFIRVADVVSVEGDRWAARTTLGRQNAFQRYPWDVPDPHPRNEEFTQEQYAFVGEPPFHEQRGKLRSLAKSVVVKAGWDESKHPRGSTGRFIRGFDRMIRDLKDKRATSLRHVLAGAKDSTVVRFTKPPTVGVETAQGKNLLYREAIVHPSAKFPGRWQITWFDTYTPQDDASWEPSGDEEYPTRKAALRSIAGVGTLSFGYPGEWKVAPFARSIIVRSAWDESKHPRVPKGQSAGGQFGMFGGAVSSKGKKIVRVLSVVDTRQYEELGDKFRAIPGSGQESTCSRCGRTHEIHAEVELEDGSRAVVGTGCMKKSEMAVASKVKSLTNTVKTIARNRAKLEALKAEKARWDAAYEKIEKKPLPKMTEATKPMPYTKPEQGRNMVEFSMGRGEGRATTFYEVLNSRHSEDPEYIESRLRRSRKDAIERLPDEWRRKQVRLLLGESMWKPRPGTLAIEDLEKRIAKLQKKVDEATAPVVVKAAWDESRHLRVPRGQAAGGQFMGGGAGAISEKIVQVIDTGKTPDYTDLSGAGVVVEGEIAATHITDDPSGIIEILKQGGRLDQGEKVWRELGEGLYASSAPQLWVGRAPAKWEFLQDLKPEQRRALGNAILQHPHMTEPHYLTESERDVVKRDVGYVVEGKMHPDILSMFADQPYNIEIWRPEFLKPLGIEPSNRQPLEVPVRFQGKFAELSGYPTEEELARMKAAGFAGAFLRSGWSHMPQIVVWDSSAVRKFGEYERPSKVVVKALQGLPPGGEWKTIRGSRVYIHNGRIVAGPAALQGFEMGQAKQTGIAQGEIDFSKPAEGGDSSQKRTRTRAKPAKAKAPAVRRRSRPKHLGGSGINDVGEKIGGARKDIWWDIAAGPSSGDLKELEKNPVEARRLVCKEKILGKFTVDAQRDLGRTGGAAYFWKKIHGAILVRPSDDPMHRARYMRGCHLLQEATQKARTVVDMKEAMSGLVDLWNKDEDERAALGSLGKKFRTHALGGGYSNTRWKIMRDATHYEAMENDPDMIALLDLVKKPEEFQARLQKKNPMLAAQLKARPSLMGQVLARIDPWGWATKADGGTGERKKRKRVIRPVPQEARRSGKKLHQYPVPSPEELIEQYGLRGAEFGNWVNDRHRQWHVWQAHMAFGDLAQVLGIEPAQVSGRGNLGIGFGARGTGWAAAHYEPAKVVMNLTRNRGGGCLAHEWGHFLDNFLAGARAKKPSTRWISHFGDRVALGKERTIDKDLEKAITGVMKAIKEKPVDTRSEKTQYTAISKRGIEQAEKAMPPHLRATDENSAQIMRALNLFREWVGPTHKPHAVMGGRKRKPTIAEAVRMIYTTPGLNITRKSPTTVAAEMKRALFKGPEALPKAKFTKDDHAAVDALVHALSPKSKLSSYALIRWARDMDDAYKAADNTMKWVESRKQISEKHTLTTTSDFLRRSRKLSKSGDYWQRPHEMFARAFEAYVQDRLGAMGAENTYLVFGTREGDYDPDIPHPYPLGEERKAINASMDNLLKVLRKKKRLLKALVDTAAFAFSGHPVVVKAFMLKPGETFPVWRTIRGTKVQIGPGGVIMKGPDALRGTKVTGLGVSEKPKIAGVKVRGGRSFQETLRGPGEAKWITLAPSTYTMGEERLHRVKVKGEWIVSGRFKGMRVEDMVRHGRLRESKRYIYDPETGAVEKMQVRAADGRMYWRVKGQAMAIRKGNRLLVMLPASMTKERVTLEKMGFGKRSGNQFWVTPKDFDQVADVLGGLSLDHHADHFLKSFADQEAKRESYREAESMKELQAFNMGQVPGLRPNGDPRTGIGRIDHLHEYQLRGIHWFCNTGSGIMGWDMGMGKTIGSIAAMMRLSADGKLKENGRNGRVLVIVPPNLRDNFAEDVGKYTSASVSLDGKDPSAMFQVTSYEMFTRHPERFKGQWGALVMDEAHYIKRDSKRTRQIHASLMDVPFKMALTGTPMTVSPLDLYNIVAFVAPEGLYSQTEFKQKFMLMEGGRCIGINPEHLDELRGWAKKYCLYLRAEDWLKKLPKATPVNQSHVNIGMTPGQARLYERWTKVNERIEAKMYARLQAETGQKNPTMTDEDRDRLRKMVSDTISVKGKRVRVQGERVWQTLRTIENTPGAIDPRLAGENPKLDAMMELIQQHQAKPKMRSGEPTKRGKTIIFAGSVALQKAIIERLKKEHGEQSMCGVVHDGNFVGGRRVSSKDTAAVVDHFNNDPDAQFVVLSTKRGKEGLNLQSASQVIHVDQPFTHADHRQATARAVRQGNQYESVDVHTIVIHPPKHLGVESVDQGTTRRNIERERMVNQLLGGEVPASAGMSSSQYRRVYSSDIEKAKQQGVRVRPAA